MVRTGLSVSHFSRRCPLLPMVLLVATVAVMSGCAAKKQERSHGEAARLPHPADQTGQEPVAGSRVEALTTGVWIQPEAELDWHGAGLLAALALPRHWQPESLQVTLNGQDVTPGFLPAYAFAKDWIPQAQGRGGDHRPLGAEPAAGVSSAWRTVAILPGSKLLPGENRLVADVLDGSGQLQAVVRLFQFHPQGRAVRFHVVRQKSGGIDKEAGARIVLIPQDGAPELDLAPSRVPFSPDLPSRRSWILARGGEAFCYLPEGRYLALATAGPLDSVEQWLVPAHGPVEHRFRIRREVRLPRHATVDFHVHGAASRDSLVPLRERVWGFLAAGVDILVATDHGTITDYRPFIENTPQARGRIRSIPGVETGSLRQDQRHYGHWGIWPLEPDSRAPQETVGRSTRHGALRPMRKRRQLERIPADESVPRMFEAYRRRARQLARRAGRRREPIDPIIELNHPRGLDRHPLSAAPARVHDWFNKVGFRPGQPLPAAGDLEAPNGSLLRPAPGGTTGLDFDVLEIWNRNSRRLYMEVRRDWFALLNQGFIRTGVANTDTHTMARVLPGYPENVVFLPPGAQGGPGVSNGDLAAAVRSGHVVGTDGPVPLLQVRAVPQRLDSVAAGPGDLLAAPTGEVRVELEVQAASWVPVGPLRIWVNGKVVATRRAGIRQATVPLTLAHDAWILAEVGDPEAVPDGQSLPGIYGQVAPHGMALGFTNPVLVDRDGNGRFDPPGLRPQGPVSGSPPRSAP